MIIESKPVGPFAMNTYVVACPETRHAAVVDSGGDVPWLQEVVERHELTVTLLLQTHAHVDHVAALDQTKALWPDAPIVMHRKDLPVYQAAPMAGRMFGVQVGDLPPIDRYIVEGDEIELGTLDFRVMFVPGHAPGHVAFISDAEGVALSGDLLFAGSIGRTDLPGCDPDQMRESLARFTNELPTETKVLCGHGPTTTIGRERERNPFLNGGF